MYLSEGDYYLGAISDALGNPVDEQARWQPDHWIRQYHFKANRNSSVYNTWIDRMKSGHITVPINSLVTLYGSIPTEMAFRLSYWPGWEQRRTGIEFLLGMSEETHNIPWGLASIWNHMGVKYTWKGVCNCATDAPFTARETNNVGELFKWAGPDGSTVMFKWYYLDGGSNQSWGGYAEARTNTTVSSLVTALNRFVARPPYVPFAGLFGYGWDDLTFNSTAPFTLVANFNDQENPSVRTARVSNAIDFFQDIEANPTELAKLSTVTGGWGMDWSLWSVSMQKQSAAFRTSMVALRLAEMLTSWVHLDYRTTWKNQQSANEAMWLDAGKYFDHSWVGAGSQNTGTSCSDVSESVIKNKCGWSSDFVSKVSTFQTNAETAFKGLFSTPGTGNRFVVVNPLAEERSDYADLTGTWSGSYTVTDLATGLQVPNQVLSGDTILRVYASNVPAAGWKIFTWASGAGQSFSDAATVTTGGSYVLGNALYDVTINTGGEITSLVDDARSDTEMVGTSNFNVYSAGGTGSLSSENVGPVSATVKVTITGRMVYVTLFRDTDRVNIENVISASQTGTVRGFSYTFADSGSGLDWRFEELGAVAKPGLTGNGGNFLYGTRADYMQPNSFVGGTRGAGGYTYYMSNLESQAVKFGSSTASAFSLPTKTIQLVTTGDPAGGGITNQADETSFTFKYALRGDTATFSGATAMRFALQAQNPLRALALPQSQSGTRYNSSTYSASLVRLSDPDLIVTALKPVEEEYRGLMLRLWNPTTSSKSASITWDTAAIPADMSEMTGIETNIRHLPFRNGSTEVVVPAKGFRTYGFSCCRGGHS